MAVLAGQYAQWERHIGLKVLPPRRPSYDYYYLTPDGTRWYWITVNGCTVWDSSDHFPLYASLEEYRALAHKRHGYGPGPENDATIARYEARMADIWAKYPELKP